MVCVLENADMVPVALQLVATCQYKVCPIGIDTPVIVCCEEVTVTVVLYKKVGLKLHLKV
jgi:hypothetical protein